MTFEALCDKIVAGFDVTQQQAVDAANERLSTMVTKAESLRAIISLGTTVASQQSYSLASNVVKVFKVWIDFTAGTQTYDGAATIEEFIDLAANLATTNGNWYVTEPDADADMNTENLRIWPAPSEAGKTINGLVALRPATLTYTSNTTIPIPIDQHPALLDGVRAELSEGEGRQDQAPLWEQSYAAGIEEIKEEENSRAKGSGHHRMRMRGYDFANHSTPYSGC